jgi:ABC-2 type transport system permease protein
MMPQYKIIRDIGILTRRSLVASLRNPFVFIPNFAISLFFLLVYSAGLSGVGKLTQLKGVSYLAFVLPVSIVSTAIGAAAAAGEALVNDLENGYFSRLVLTPVSRVAIVLGPVITGMFQLVLQSLLLVLAAVLMGLEIDRGYSGLLLLLLLTSGWGLAFTGYAVAIALSTQKAQSVQMGTMIFFPLIYLSTTFVPLDLIETGWLRVAATVNPTTYIFEGIRAVLIDGWMPGAIFPGLLVGLAGSVITIIIATCNARRVFNQ